MIQTGPIHIGNNAYVGEASVLDIDTAMEDDTQLGHASSLQCGQRVPQRQALSWLARAGDHGRLLPARRRTRIAAAPRALLGLSAAAGISPSPCRSPSSWRTTATGCSTTSPARQLIHEHVRAGAADAVGRDAGGVAGVLRRADSDRPDRRLSGAAAAQPVPARGQDLRALRRAPHHLAGRLGAFSNSATFCICCSATAPTSSTISSGSSATA